MKVFDKGLPALPENFFTNVGDIFKITESDFNRAVRAAAITQQLEYPAPSDQAKFLGGEYSVGSQMSVMQQWKRHGQRFVSVEETVLSDAENTDCLATLHGSDIRQTLKSFALWFPRRVRGTFAHLGLVRFYDREEIKHMDGGNELEYEVGGKRRLAKFRAGTNIPTGASMCGLLSATLFHSYESVEGQEYLGVHGGVSIAGSNFRGTPAIVKEEDIIRADRGVLETFVVPVYDTMTLLDSFCSTIDQDEMVPMRAMYLKNSDPRTPLEQTRQSFLSSLNVICSLMQVMSSYPEYRTIKQIKCRIQNPKNPKKKITKPFRIEELRAPVSESNRTLPDPAMHGVSRRSHWRRGHWRRQIHSQIWRLEHPEDPVIEMPDGRDAHLSWIKPVWIGN